MRSMPLSLAMPLILTCALLASSCGDRARIQPAFPPAADVEASQAGKPKPTPAIVTDAQARADYRAAVEEWGDGVHDAAVRLCRWFNERGASFACGIASGDLAAVAKKTGTPDGAGR